MNNFYNYARGCNNLGFLWCQRFMTSTFFAILLVVFRSNVDDNFNILNYFRALLDIFLHKIGLFIPVDDFNYNTFATQYNIFNKCLNSWMAGGLYHAMECQIQLWWEIERNTSARVDLDAKDNIWVVIYPQVILPL